MSDESEVLKDEIRQHWVSLSKGPYPKACYEENSKHRDLHIIMWESVLAGWVSQIVADLDADPPDGIVEKIVTSIPYLDEIIDRIGEDCQILYREWRLVATKIVELYPDKMAPMASKPIQ